MHSKSAHKINLVWGFIILLITAILFCITQNISTSAFYTIISACCGIFLIMFRKDIPLFSPIFMLFSSIFINIGFPALYFLKEKTPFSEELLQNTSIIYLIYFLALITPVFFANRIFKKHSKIINRNFIAQNINFYLIFSNILLIFFIVILLKITGFSYLEALKNPLHFRFAASAGSLAYIRKLVILLFMVNTFIFAKYNFTHNQYKNLNPVKLKFFTIFHVLFLLLFAVISGSRSVILLPVVSSIAIYTFYNKISFKAIFSTVLIFAITLVLISFYAAYRNHSKINITPQLISRVNIVDETMKRLDSFKNSLYFFEYIDREDNTIIYFKDFHILEQIKDQFLQPFPRNIIPDKGYYFSSLMTEKVFNSDINESKITYNFGGISNAFWNFGLSGIILEGLMLGLSVVWLHRKFLQLITHDCFFIFFMTTFFFIPNSIIVDGFWNTMDACGYFMNIIVVFAIIGVLSFKPKQNDPY